MIEWPELLSNCPKGFAKLVKTLVANPISSLYEPLGHKRLESAKAHSARQSKLMEAQTERDVRDILDGKLTYDDKFTKSLVNQNEELTENAFPDLRNEPYIDFSSIQKLQEQENERKELRKQINVAECLKHAEQAVLKEPDESIADEDIDTDWFNEWHFNAEKISSEHMKKVWGKVLAGELVKPKSYSLRTLNTLKLLSKEEGILFEKLASFVSYNFCLRDIILHQFQKVLTPHDLMILEEAGLIDDIGENSRTITLTSVNQETYVKPLVMGDWVLIIRKANIDFKLTIPIIKLTSVGRELMGLAFVSFNDEYLKKCAEYFKIRGCSVSRAKLLRIEEDGSLTFGKEQQL